MKLCDYQILEYATSELQTHGMPFIVVLRRHALDSYTLSGYVLRDWERKIEGASKNELGDVEVFLKDLQHHCRKQDNVAPFFDGLDGMSVGPIRALASGSCSIQDLDAVIQAFFDEKYGSIPWRENFYNFDDDAFMFLIGS